ncbi:MAG TPA: orotate phosphoribosyltransferase [Candidatus Dormibacteraeota bacterium]|nr:orotate phosphoribosyltransferase [Candidatus Dormibacteraeota bacterium]
MDATQLRSALIERGALLEGHFRLSSGRHSDRFIQKFRILEEPKLLAPVAAALAARFAASRPTIVLSAAIGGIVLGYEVARALALRAIFVEKENGVPVLRRGFAIEPGDRVLVVEDVVTTGGSVREVLGLVAENGAHAVGVGAIVARATPDFGVPFEALLEMPIDSYDPQNCPHCIAGAPILDPGSRRR